MYAKSFKPDFDSHNFENPVQVVVAEIFDYDFPLARAVLELDFRVEPQGDFVFDVADDCRLARALRRRSRVRTRRFAFHSPHGVLRPAHVQPVFDDFAREDFLLGFVVEPHNHLRRPQRKHSACNVPLHALGQIQKAQQIRDCRTLLAKPLRNRLLREVEIGNQIGDTPRGFNRVEIGALDIFDKPLRGGGGVADILDARHDFAHAQQLASPEPALSREQLVSVGNLPHENRLEQPLGRNRLRQIFYFVLRKLAARLIRACRNLVGRDFGEEPVGGNLDFQRSGGGGHCGGRSRADFANPRIRGLFRARRDNRAQPPAQ